MTDSRYRSQDCDVEKIKQNIIDFLYSNTNGDYAPTRAALVTRVELYHRIYGDDEIYAMNNFILYATDQIEEGSESHSLFTVMFNVYHDLNGAGTRCFSPRTRRYLTIGDEVK